MEMNKRGGLFAIFWIIMAIIGVLVVITIFMTFVGGDDVDKICENSCDEYDYEFFEVDESIYETKCWCLDDNDKPTLVPWLKTEAWYERFLPESIKWLV